MAYTKYSLTPANNTAAPPDGAPEGMLPSAVNDTMRDMMSQIRDVGDGVRDGTYTMTAPKITGGTITGVAITSSTGSFTTLSTSSTTTFSGLTASTALALDASKNVVSVTNTGTGNNVLSASPTLTGTIAGASLSLSSLTSGRVTFASTSGLLADSANLTWDGSFLTAASIKDTALTSGRVTYAGASGLLKDSANMTFDDTSLTLGGQIFLSNNNYIGFKNTSASVSASIFNDTSNFLNLYNSSNTGTIFYVNAGERLRLTNTSLYTASGVNVGIGTSSPAFKTEIVGGATTVETTLFQIRSDAGGIGTGSTIAFANSTSTTAGSGRVELAAIRTTSSGGSFVIRTGDDSGTIQERMRITSAGNVGINTNDPDYGSYGATERILGITGVATNRARLSLQNTSTGTTGVAGTLAFFNGSTLLASLDINADGATNKGLYAFNTNNGTSVSERMRITNTGNVGIGTSSPNALLGIATTTMNSQILLGVSTSNSAYGSISLNGSSADNGRLGFTGGGTGDNTLYIDVPTNGAYGFRLGGTNVITVNSSGIVTMGAYGAGAATFSASGVISSVSDETWKTKDGVPNNPDLMLQKLEPGYWFYNEEKAPIFGEDRQLGFYAQNVHEAIGAEAAPTPEEGKPWGYYDRSVLAVAVMSLKNALNTIEELKQRIKTLENK